jgi:branched-chain amino acid transport system permease protein
MVRWGRWQARVGTPAAPERGETADGRQSAAVLAGLAGLVLAPILAVNPWMGMPLLLKAFVVVVLGGLGSLPGAVVGGLMLGIVEAIGVTFLSSEWREVVAFGVLIVVLWLRPQGLFGIKGREA